MLDGDPWGRSMWPWEFRALVERHLHPRFWNVWIHCDRWGRRQRESGGVPVDLATLFVSTFEGPPEDVLVVPQNQLPFRTRLTTYEIDGGGDLGMSEAYIGWRPAVVKLVKGGYLKPSDTLSRLIREDSFDLCPTRFGGHA